MSISETEIARMHKLIAHNNHKTTAGFKALSDPNRYSIFRILMERPGLSVSNIARILSISKPLASRHLNLLMQVDLVHKERSGKKIHSTLNMNNPFVRAIIQMIIVSSRTADRRSKSRKK